MPHTPSAAECPIKIGDVVDKYRVERVLGVGAMGLVVSARHHTLDQVVAIKFLLEHRFGSRDESTARFASEARAAAKIQSDHVCRVSDVGTMPTGVPYMIMEHLEGNDLEEEIVHRGQLAITEAVDYVLQALDAMAAAHQLGIVHRDLKPANLFLARRPDGSRRVKVLDFGISKATGQGTTGAAGSATSRKLVRFTRETRSLGTPAYMPPEQIRDPMNVDHRVDIWALGCILYEALTGQMAFVGDTVSEVLERVLGDRPCPIATLRRDVPPGLIQIVECALRRNRDERFQTAALFARALSFYGSIGVLSSLASIQREVGSLSSISAVPLGRPHTPYPPTPSVQPMVIGPPSSSSSVVMGASVVRRAAYTTEPDPSEVSRRHVITKNHLATTKRHSQAKSAVMATATVVLVAVAMTIMVHRLGTQEASPPPPTPAALAPQAPTQLDPPPKPSAIPSVIPSVIPTAIPIASASAKPVSTNVRPASNSVHSARNVGTQPRPRPH